MAKKGHQQPSVIKALKKANRELEMERNGAQHPWVAVDRPHRNLKKYDRKNQKKELRGDLDSFYFYRQHFLGLVSNRLCNTYIAN